jgi:hypothetical protein
MGKKRRILNRARKFASKYFQWMDKSDGTDDNILSDVPQYIDALTITDNENQSVKIEGFALGPINAGADEIDYSIDGAAYVNAGAVFTDEGVGETTQRYSFAVDTAPAATGSVSVGNHKITVRMKDDTDALRYKSANISVRENKIELGGLADAFKDNAAANMEFVSIEMTVISGVQKAGSEDAVSFANPSSNGFKIEVLDAAGDNVNLTGDVTSITIARLADLTDNSEDIADLLKEAVTDDTDFTVKITPLDSDDNELTDSVVTQAVTVLK